MTATWLCSADSHFIEPADLWTSRIDLKYRQRAPRWEDDGDFRYAVLDGARRARISVSLMGLEDGQAIPSDPADRLPLLDKDGVWAESLIGNLGLTLLFSISDPGFAGACAQVYNNYIVDVYESYAARQVPIALIPLPDVDLAVREIERVANLGIRGIALPIIPPEPYFLPKWEPVWSAADANGLPVLFHVHSGGSPGNKRLKRFVRTVREYGSAPDVCDAEKTIGALEETVQGYTVLASLVGGGVLERHPRLHILFVETNAAWLALAFELMDWAWAPAPGQGRATSGIASFDEAGAMNIVPFNVMGGGNWTLPLRPSEYARRQVLATFMDEGAAIRFREYIGTASLIWGSDFPHAEGTWPRSHEIVDALFVGVDASDRADITVQNFARLYNVTVPSNRYGTN